MKVRKRMGDPPVHGFVWLPPVIKMEDVPCDPDPGDAILVRNVNKAYVFEGPHWVELDEHLVGPFFIDGTVEMMTTEEAELVGRVQEKMRKRYG